MLDGIITNPTSRQTNEQKWTVIMTDKNPTQGTRREMLKGVGAGFFTIGTGSGLATADGNDDTVIITISRDKDGPIREKEVPRTWNEHREHARSMTENFTSDYYPKEGVKSVGKAAGPDRYGGKRGFQINVRINPKRFEGTFPDQVQGIPVNVIEEPPDKEEGLGICEGNAGDFDPVTGGVVHGEGDGDTCLGFGTTYMKLINSDNEGRMLSAAHIWEGCSTNPTGQDAHQAGEYYGTVSDYDPQSDWIAIQPDPNASIDTTSLSKILEPDGTSRQVVGYFSSSGVDDYIVTGNPVFQNGVTTGRDDGPIKENQVSDGFDCVDFDGYGIRCKIHNSEGDSGGPVYEIQNDGDAEAICIYQKYESYNLGENSCDPAGPCSDDSLKDAGYLVGTAHHHLRNTYGFTLAKGI